MEKQTTAFKVTNSNYYNTYLCFKKIQRFFKFANFDVLNRITQLKPKLIPNNFYFMPNNSMIIKGKNQYPMCWKFRVLSKYIFFLPRVKNLGYRDCNFFPLIIDNCYYLYIDIYSQCNYINLSAKTNQNSYRILNANQSKLKGGISLKKQKNDKRNIRF